MDSDPAPQHVRFNILFVCNAGGWELKSVALWIRQWNCKKANATTILWNCLESICFTSDDINSLILAAQASNEQDGRRRSRSARNRFRFNADIVRSQADVQMVGGEQGGSKEGKCRQQSKYPCFASIANSFVTVHYQAIPGHKLLRPFLQVESMVAHVAANRQAESRRQKVVWAACYDQRELMSNDLLLWVGFIGFLLAMLAVDLGVFHRTPHVVSMREALGWSVVWITLALVFNGVIYYWFGWSKALEFLTGYLVEKSLSVDNIFVILLIFSYFKVPAAHQHKVLFWGVVGALVMRGLFIVIGVSLLQQFHWLIYIFGGFLIITGIRLGTEKEKEIHPEKNPVLKLFRRLVPVTEKYEDDKFFVKRAGRLLATPLFIVLLVVETTDLIFAVDSIPAVMAVTLDPFIVFTSNVFAVLGLRSLYFALAGIMAMFHYLHYGLAVILVFVGSKMLLMDVIKIPIGIALGVIAVVLAVSVIASLRRQSVKTPVR
jgi:TerC family integral membrane protein